jgi:hypothetical protein
MVPETERVGAAIRELNPIIWAAIIVIGLIFGIAAQYNYHS